MLIRDRIRTLPAAACCVVFVVLLAALGGPTWSQDPPDSASSSADEAETPPAADSDALVSEEALARFQQLLQRRPFHDAAFDGLVKHFAERGRLQDLVEEYERKVEALPDDRSNQVILARLYLRSGAPDRAAEVLDRVEQLSESDEQSAIDLLVFKSEIFQRTGRLPEAQQMLRQAMEQTTAIARRLKLGEALADLHLRSGDADEAGEVLRALAEEFPDNYLHRKRVADALAQRDLHEQALVEYEVLRELAGDEVDRQCEVLRHLGRSQERLGRTDEAIATYTDAMHLLSGDHWLRHELHERVVNLYRGSGRLDELVEYCRDQIDRAPEQTAMRMLLADVLLAAGDPDGVRAVMKEAVELFPRDRMISERRVLLLERLGALDEASSEYERIITHHPDDVELYITYGQFLATTAQLDAARNQWRHVLETGVSSASMASRLGALFEPYELYDDAADCYERAITLSPEQPEAYLALSRLEAFRGNRDEAAAVLQRAAESNPDNPDVQAAVSQGLLNIGLTDEALEAITLACALTPDNLRHQTARADLLIRAGRLDEALEVRRSIIDRINNPPQQAQAITVLVSMYASAGRLEELVAQERQRHERNPQDTVALLLLARAADLQHDFAAARQWLSALLDADPAHEQGRLQLARLLEATGDVEAATEEYQRLIELHPARSRTYYQAVADVRLRYGDKMGAIETFEKMVARAPENTSVLQSVAEQLVRLDEAERALPYYEQALSLQPQRHEIRLEHAKALTEAGRYRDAQEQFRTAALQQSDRETAAQAMIKLHETAERLGTLDELLEELQALVEADPENVLVARTLAQLLIREFEYNRAMELLDLAQRYQPRDPELGLVRGELLRRLARFDAALEEYERLLRFPNVDRDYLLGEMGKACFEAGRIDQARRLWRQIGNKLYAGSLLKNNGVLDDAIEVLREGIRFQPDDYGLHRSLIAALEAAGREAEALEAARRLLDLEPDNVQNIQQLASACLEKGDRETATEIASRLFSASVLEQSGQGLVSSGPSWASNRPLWMVSMQSSWRWAGYGYNPARSNLDRAVEFFQENGLLTELEEVLLEQLEAQPDNAVLRLRAAPLFSSAFGKPAEALGLLRELETMEFPLEYQEWLGQSSQRDAMRIQQYQLIATRPDLRDGRLAALEARPREELSRDERLELAVIRHAQGNHAQAIDLLLETVEEGQSDVIGLSLLVQLLITAERFQEAEPFALELSALLAEQRAQMKEEMIERVRRDFVRSLPLEFQLRLDEKMLESIALKWMLGQSFISGYTGTLSTMGFFAARLALGTIYAETERLEQARDVWRELEPAHEADADGWTMLASVAQLHDQHELAFEYYLNALEAAKLLARDRLLQRIYGGSSTQVWYGQEAVDSSFNKVVEAFARNDKLPELYDFLRESDQTVKARRIVDQYELHDDLEPVYQQRFEESRADLARVPEDALNRSVACFLAACKLAELHDQQGDWERAKEVYQRYLEVFPDEIALLQVLGEVAETQRDYEEAIAWEQKVLEAKERLQSRARDWSMRQVAMLPGIPQILASRVSAHEWTRRWGRDWYGSGYSRGQLERAASWMRLAQLYLASENVIGAGEAFQQAVAEGGANRERLLQQVLALIQQRRLTSQMLSVLRTLAVHAPASEQVQLAFAESLEANDRAEVATEVYRRMLRRGVSDLGVLAQVRRRLSESGSGEVEDQHTVAQLEAEVETDPNNARNRLRLAKAYYYSQRIDDALEVLLALAADAPHLEDLHTLLVEVYTLKGDTEPLMEALRSQIARTKDETTKTMARQRLAEELLAAGRTEEAIATLKELADPRDPTSYHRVGLLLHYFGRHDEALKQFELASRSQQQSPGGYDMDTSGLAIAQALALKGDLEAATFKVLETAEEFSRQSMQYGMSIYGMNAGVANHFQQFGTLFVLYPAIADAVRAELERRLKEKPGDLPVSKLLVQLHRQVGRTDIADELMDEMVAHGHADQAAVNWMIDKAIQRRAFDRAVALAEDFIAQQPKPKIPPGMPPQYAGMALLSSPRNAMICKLGDVYWKMGEKDKALETYRGIVDEEFDATKTSYAMICLLRERVDEARSLVDEALAAQQVKSADLLEFRAYLAALEGDAEKTFALLAEAAEAREGAPADPYMGMNEGGGPQILAAFSSRTGLVDRFVAFMEGRISRQPHEWQNFELLSSTLREAGRANEALAVLERAAQQTSLRKQALEHRRYLVEKYSSPKELIALYEELIDLSEREVPSESRMRYGYGGSTGEADQLRARLGDLLWEQGEQERAVEIWTQRKDLNDPATHYTLGSRLIAREAWTEAEESLRETLRLQPDYVAAHRALAGLAYQSADADLIRDHLWNVFAETYEPRSQDEYDPYRRSRSRGSDEQMHLWAIEIAPAGDTDHAALQLNEDQRLMIAVLIGDWTTAEQAVHERLSDRPCDPLGWTLLSSIHQRNGNWSEAAAALDFIRRLQRTSLPDHRTQLQLVLAGDQIQDAAAGSAQAAAQGAAATSRMMSRSRGFGGYYGYGDEPSVDIQQLASIYVMLDRFEEAERLYLVGQSSSGGSGFFSSLANLMWQQNAKERAVELMRLAVLFSSEMQILPRFATMLAESGRPEEATDLLIRAYRGLEAQQDSWGYWYDSSGGGFEDGMEQAVSSALYDILSRAGILDQTLASITAQLEESPGDRPLGKLALSLQMKGRQWEDAERSLAEWSAAHPHDLGVKAELLHAKLQLGRWDEAMMLLESLRAEAPDRDQDWLFAEIFTHVMRGEPEKAADLAAAMLEDPNDRSAVRAWPVLAMSGELERLEEILESRRAEHQLDGGGEMVLCRVYLLNDQRGKAARLALDELWRSTEALQKSSGWFRALEECTRGVDEGANLQIAEASVEDQALITLISKGPQEAINHFESIVEEKALPEGLDARRGLILAATEAGEAGRAAEVNGELLEWLSARRDEVWRPARHQPLGEMSARMLQLYQRTFSDTGSMLSAGSYAGYSRMLTQGLSYAEEPVSYEGLWQTHSRLQADLLLKKRDPAAFAAHVEKQKDDLDFDQEQQRWLQQQMRTRMSSSFGSVAYSSRSLGGWPWEEEWGGDARLLMSDWRSFVRQAFHRHRLYRPLCAEVRTVERRLPRQQWLMASEAFAASGEADEAERWRQRWKDVDLLIMRATDQPSVSGSDSYSSWWWWSWYDPGSNELDQIRQRLSIAIPEPREEMTVEGSWGSFHSLSAQALFDPALESRLRELEEQVGPGWSSSRTTRELLSLYRWRQDHRKIIDLLEQIEDAGGVVQSNHLSTYLRACLLAEDYERIERVLSDLEKTSVTLRNDIDLLRLMVLRHQGLDDDADQMEADLLTRCREEPLSPVRLDPSLQVSSALAGRSYGRSVARQTYALGYSDFGVEFDGYAEYPQAWIGPGNLNHVSDLASSLGVRYDRQVTGEDLTINEVAQAYRSHRLFKHEARILDRQLARADLPEHERSDLLLRKAQALQEAGDADAARSLARELEQAFLQSLEQDPSDGQTHWRLGTLYESDMFGKDWERACNHYREAGRLDPTYDQTGRKALLGCLYQLRRYEEAWPLYEIALQQNSLASGDVKMLYQAAVAAHHAGARDEARSLLQQAQWRNPQHEMAAEVQELIDE